jgi:hypothetical protein
MRHFGNANALTMLNYIWFSCSGQNVTRCGAEVNGWMIR